ncbi:redoxin family protein [bacterium]|nr:redoxin family protein [bacterium]
MRNYFVLTPLFFLLFLWLAACATSNNQVAPLPVWDYTKEFSVLAEDGEGTFTPVLTVEEGNGQAVVTVNATEASDLSAAYVHVTYDPARYTPESVEIGSFLGAEGEIISLALVDIAGEVPVGIAQVPSTGVQPRNGDGLLATVIFREEPFTALRNASKTSQNAVDDLAIIEQTTSSAKLQWTEKNPGDYDNNGEVGISDLTPIGQHFNVVVVSASDPIHAALVDGDGNGEINIADITTIGQNYGNYVECYILYGDAGSSEVYAPLILRSEQEVEFNRPVVYMYTVLLEAGAPPPQLSVRPGDTGASNIGPPSNFAQVVDDPGPPNAPTGLSAETGEAAGSGNIKLSWTKSTFNVMDDLRSYHIERKLSSEDEFAWSEIAETSKIYDTYTDQGLAEESYDYRVLAEDLSGQFSGYSNVASGTPWIYIPTVSPPENLTWSSTQSSRINLNWDAPSDGSAWRFQLYVQGQEFTDPTVIFSSLNDTETSYTHTVGTPEIDYDYWVTSLDTGLNESEPSNVSTAQAIAAPPIDILDFTTDKTTHYANGGDDAAANLHVETNTPPDSVTWDDGGVGTFTGSGVDVSWKPKAGASVQLVDIKATVYLGGSEVTSDPLTMYLTNETIKTYHIDRADNVSQLPIGDPPGSGYLTDLDLSTLQYLEPLSQGGSIGMGSGMLREFTEGKAFMLDFWELWCPPCLAEFPELDNFAEFYEPYGYLQVSLSNDSRAQYNLDAIKAWFEGNGIDYIYQFFGHSNSYAESMGYDYYVPYNLLIDRDGNVRRTGGQAFGWDGLIAELTGGPSMP